MKIVIVVSSFGYGHLTRQIALKDALLELKSDLEILFVISEKQYKIFHSEILTSDQVSYALIPLTPTIVIEDNYSVDIESTKEIFSRLIRGWRLAITLISHLCPSLFPVDFKSLFPKIPARSMNRSSLMRKSSSGGWMKICIDCRIFH